MISNKLLAVLFVLSVLTLVFGGSISIAVVGFVMGFCVRSILSNKVISILSYDLRKLFRK